MLDLAVVIVTWNTRTLVLDALRTLCADLESSGLRGGVWVVDNASADGTPDAVREAFPAVKLITSTVNLGFGAGNNLALRALGFKDQPGPNPDGPRAVFLLNPDTLVQPGAVRTLYEALFSLPQAGLVGAQLSYEDGAFQHSAFRFPGLLQIIIDLYPLPDRLRGRLYETRLNGRYRRALYAGGAPFPVDHTLGATMLLRRAVIEQTGLFDEQFFMYAEEVDWSMRIREAGWQIYAVPAAHVTHLEGRSTRQIRPESLVNLWKSRFRLYDKHYPPLKRALARRLVSLGIRLHMGRTRDAALIEAYLKILSL
jgi:GT2 family glycosyltransferase